MAASNIEEEFHLKDYVSVIRRRIGFVVLFFITLVSVVAVISFNMKPVYRATTTLLVDIENPDVLTTSGVVSLESRNYYAYKEYYQSQIEIITSRSIVHRVFNEFNLSRKEEYAEAKDPVNNFLKTITVEPVRDTRLLKLHVDNKDPELAAEIANRIANIYVNRNLYYISRDEMRNLLKNEYLKLDAKLSEYSKTYKDRHPQMIRLREEMKEMIESIENVKKATFEYDVSEEDFAAKGGYPIKGLKANNVSILDPAEKPVIPTKPKKKLYVLLAAVMGFFGGIGLAFFFEYLDDTVKSIEDTEKLADWLLLGAVSEIGKVKKGFKKYEKGFLAHIKPKDSVVEVYRSIRTRLLISSAEDQPLCMVVTSPGPGEGKTTNLSNLGTVIANSGKRVLLVDADMRKPNLHKIFRKKNIGKKSEKGLSDFLSGRAEFEDLVQETEIENTFLVTCGVCPPNPSELISSDKMKEFINSAKENFDFVLFDTPPVAVVTDTVILSKLTDGLIMVIESGKTPKKVILRISKSLKTSNIKVIGAILNRISIKENPHNYYYRQYSS